MGEQIQSWIYAPKSKTQNNGYLTFGVVCMKQEKLEKVQCAMVQILVNALLI